MRPCTLKASCPFSYPQEISYPGLHHYIVSQVTTISQENRFWGSDGALKLWDFNLLEGTFMNSHLFLIMRKGDTIMGHAKFLSFGGWDSSSNCLLNVLSYNQSTLVRVMWAGGSDGHY